MLAALGGAVPVCRTNRHIDSDIHARFRRRRRQSEAAGHRRADRQFAPDVYTSISFDSLRFRKSERFLRLIRSIASCEGGMVLSMPMESLRVCGRLSERQNFSCARCRTIFRARTMSAAYLCGIVV